MSGKPLQDVASGAPASAPSRRPSWTDDDRALLVEEEHDRTRLSLESGEVVAGKYVLEKPAGFGGMAQLWVATNKATGAEVCVKLLVPDVTDDEAVERFRREAHAAAKLSHRAIVRVFDLVELDEKGAEAAPGARPHALAIVMELLRGETVGDVLMKRGKISLEETLDIFLPVVSALAHAHRAGVIHRDVKPDNIFLAVDPDGHVTPKVLDFGLSKLSNAAMPLTLDGVLLGTPSFMSPEQAKGAPSIDAKSDVFSAGIVLYMMLTGTNPFDDASFDAIVSAILNREPPPIAGLTPHMWSVLAKALAKKPADRFNDATEFGIALRKATGRKSFTETGGTGMPSVRSPFNSSMSVPPTGHDSVTPAVPVIAPPPAQTNRRLALGIGLAVLALAALLILVALEIASSSGSTGPTDRAPNPVSSLVSPTPPPLAESVPATPSTPAAPLSAAPATADPASEPPGAASGARPPTDHKRDPPLRGVPRRPSGQEPSNSRSPGF